ncbi:MAG: prepilin-type N-terminal cleavage/methylation domain-containing protein [Patescibacteria group bacterium]|jgi:prepilin-type N-terminal cleavage/methylation domain-containing protein
MNHLSKNQNGFTLIEMIISLSIFVMTILAAINVYLIINNSQRKVVAMQRVQDDLRYVFETLAQQVRLGSINYSFYADNGIELYPQAGVTNKILAIFNQSGEEIYFRQEGDGVQYCKVEIAGDCDLATGTGWFDITPVGVSISQLQFIITPSANPFTPSTAVACTAGSAKTLECLNIYGYSCSCTVDPCFCQYYSDGGNFQPKVRISMTAMATEIPLPEKSRTVSMQTTISLRRASGQVLNLNYD